MNPFLAGFADELVKLSNAADFILSEIPGANMVQRGMEGGPREAGKAFVGMAAGGVPGALLGRGAGRLIEHAFHRGKPIRIPGVNLSVSELMSGIGGTIGAIKGLRHFSPGKSG